MSQDTPQPFSESEKQKIRELRQQGLSGDNIAKKIGRSKSGVHRFLTIEGFLGKKRPKNKQRQGVPLTQEEKDQIIALFKKGGTTGSAIAREIGRAQSVVSRVIREAGLYSNKHGGRRLKVDTKAESQILELHGRGHSGRAIAKLLGRSPNAVLRVLRQSGRNGSGTGSGTGSDAPVLARPRVNGSAALHRLSVATPTLVRGQQAPMLHLWQAQLTSLVGRIRRVDSGVTSIEIDVKTGDYIINRVSSERGNI